MKPEPAPPVPSPPRRWFLARRLTRHYTVATVVLLLAAAGFLYWRLQRSLLTQDMALVASKAQVLRLLLREQSDRADVLASEVEHETGEAQALKYYLRVVDAQGRTVIETTGMVGLLPPRVFPEPIPVDLRPEQSVLFQLKPGREFLLLAARAEMGGAAPEIRTVQIALDVTHNRELLAGYRQQMLLMLAVGGVLACLGGWAVARSGLRPLRKIAQTMQSIKASQLDRHLASDRWPAELTELAAAFDDMMDRLKDSFARLSHCGADLAHALRNPINNLRGEAEVALAQERTPAEYQQILSSSLEEYERLSRLIDGLLFIARTDDPTATIEHARFAARREMDAVQEFYEALAAERGVTVICEGEARVHGDAMLFRRAVSNLLANALKHTPAGGRVRITARENTAGSAEIQVQDTGEGIPAGQLPRVFDRFYQVRKSRDQTAQGAGLGLAVVKSIMQLHRGTVEIASEAGQGATLTLRFPPPPA